MRDSAIQFQIVTLRERPEFVSVVSDRIWNAWWRSGGHAREMIEGKVRESLRPEAIPMAYVAVSGESFLGTASLIESDMEERPQYSPWVAALWVEPAYRQEGIGAALAEATLQAGFASGAPTVYLCAEQNNAPYYRKRGWRTVEPDVGGLEVFSRSR